MDSARREELLDVYRRGLLEDVVPFWIRHAIDREHGGFFSALDRDGTVIDTDKGMWIQGRFTWLLSTLHATVEARDEWLDLALHGIEFISRHGFDDDGRMFFVTTRDGKPLRKRRYLFTEAFALMAFAAYARASGDDDARRRAVEIYELIQRYLSTPGLLEPKGIPGTRPMKSIGVPMILVNVAQVLRGTIGYESADTDIDRCIGEIRDHFVKPERQVVMENVGPEGEIFDHFDGRILNPGHAIEAAWFILQEAKLRGGDAELTTLGCNMLDWMWRRGWDEEHGGVLYFRDVDGRPVQEYWHDMKFWWPQNETIIATLLAYQLTGADRYAEMHAKIHDWTYERFPDAEHGEWFGYFHRDGRLSVPLKGNLWKGPFHIPRMQLVCWKILEEMKG